MSNQLQVFKQELGAHHKSLSSVLPSHITPEKFCRTVMGAVQNDPSLLEADRQSLFNACQKAAQDGLMLDGREAALVVYNTKKGNQWVKAASYQPMIDGILKKLRNSGQLAKIEAISVHKQDIFKYNPGEDEVPNHSPDWFGARGDFMGVYAVATLKDGSKQVEIMNLEQIEKIRQCSKSGTNKDTGEAQGIWKTWYEEKAKVACIKRLAKRLPSSSDIEQLFAHDNEDYSNAEVAEYDNYEGYDEHIKKQGERLSKGQTKTSQLLKANVKPRKPNPEQETVIESTGEIIESDPI